MLLSDVFSHRSIARCAITHLAQPIHPAMVCDAHDVVARRRARLGVGRASERIICPAV